MRRCDLVTNLLFYFIQDLYSGCILHLQLYVRYPLVSPPKRYLLYCCSFANWFAQLGSRVSRCCLDLESGVCALCNLQSAAFTHILKHSWRGVEDYRVWIEALDLFRGKWAAPLRSWAACWEVAMPRTDLSRIQSRNEKIKNRQCETINAKCVYLGFSCE